VCVLRAVSVVSAQQLLCYTSQGSFSNTLKDNTGKGPGNYIEDLIFPTLSFPSDHGSVSSQMTPSA
jgi:hypothetical protein